MSNNNLQDSGVKLLCAGLKNIKCDLETLRFLSAAADEGCQFVTGIVGKNPLLLKELSLSGHELGDTRVNQLSALLQDKHCQINTLILSHCSITEEQCVILTSALKSNLSHLRELNLSGNQIRKSGLNLLCDVLKDSHCKLETLRLNDCKLTDRSCSTLAAVLRSENNLKELNMSYNNLQDSGVKLLCAGLKNIQCKLEILSLSDCSISEEGYKALASALRSNPSHLIELDLRGNDPGQSGVKELTEILQDPHCTLNTLRFLSPAADEFCQFVTGVVDINPLLLKELNLSDQELGDTRVNQLSALLQDEHCQINTLILWRCSITEKQCVILTSALKSNPSHLRELNLSLNNLGDSGVKNLSDLLMETQFKLEILDLWDCSITEKQCDILTSALKSNPSHLRELSLIWNKLGDSGVKNLSDLLMKPQFKLEKLNLCECSITEEQCVILASALKSNPSHLRELNLSENQIRNTGVSLLCDVLKDSHCKLETLRLFGCGITDVSSLTQCLMSTKALQFLKELDLSFNHIGDSKQKLIDVMRDSNCKLIIEN
nr:ribonuclease inhibitor [Danio rerio]|eukprot:XP_021325364.1 ribonuclease inhibitor [Danio rerio]